MDTTHTAAPTDSMPALASWPPALSGSLAGYREPLRGYPLLGQMCTGSYVTGSLGRRARGDGQGLRTLAKDPEQEPSWPHSALSCGPWAGLERKTRLPNLRDEGDRGVTGSVTLVIIKTQGNHSCSFGDGLPTPLV